MTHHRIDLETSLVAPELRDKLFRVDPRALTNHVWMVKEPTEEYISNITESLICVGVLTPVLIDNDDFVIAGPGLVDAAIRIDLDDIPALRLEALGAAERKIFVKSMRRYFDIAELDQETFRAEAHYILSVISDRRADVGAFGKVAEMKPA